MSINQVVISGNLGSDAELRQTQSGASILSMTVAVNERHKDQSGEWSDYTNWIDCTLFGRRAESIAKYLAKGTKVSVQGRLHQSKWQTKDGQKRSKLEVIVDEIEFMSRNADATKPEQNGEASVHDSMYADSDIPF